MAAITPPQLIPGYTLMASGATVGEQGIFIPLGSLQGLTATEGDDVTGDGRKVAFELVRLLEAQFSAMPTADRPTRMSIAQRNPVGTSFTSVRRYFDFQFEVGISDSDVVPE